MSRSRKFEITYARPLLTCSWKVRILKNLTIWEKSQKKVRNNQSEKIGQKKMVRKDGQKKLVRKNRYLPNKQVSIFFWLFIYWLVRKSQKKIGTYELGRYPFFLTNFFWPFFLTIFLWPIFSDWLFLTFFSDFSQIVRFLKILTFQGQVSRG